MIRLDREYNDLKILNNERNVLSNIIYMISNDENVKKYQKNLLDYYLKFTELTTIEKYHFQNDNKEYLKTVQLLFKTLLNSNRFKKYNGEDFYKCCNVFPDYGGENFLKILGYFPLSELYYQLFEIEKLEKEIESLNQYESTEDYFEKTKIFRFSENENIETRDIEKEKEIALNKLEKLDKTKIFENIKILAEEMKDLEISKLGIIYFNNEKETLKIEIEELTKNLKNFTESTLNIKEKH